MFPKLWWCCFVCLELTLSQAKQNSVDAKKGYIMYILLIYYILWEYPHIGTIRICFRSSAGGSCWRRHCRSAPAAIWGWRSLPPAPGTAERWRDPEHNRTSGGFLHEPCPWGLVDSITYPPRANGLGAAKQAVRANVGLSGWGWGGGQRLPKSNLPERGATTNRPRGHFRQGAEFGQTGGGPMAWGAEVPSTP